MKIYIVQTVLHHPDIGLFLPVYTDLNEAEKLHIETGAEILENETDRNFDNEDS